MYNIAFQLSDLQDFKSAPALQIPTDPNEIAIRRETIEKQVLGHVRALLEEAVTQDKYCRCSYFAQTDFMRQVLEGKYLKTAPAGAQHSWQNP